MSITIQGKSNWAHKAYETQTFEFYDLSHLDAVAIYHKTRNESTIIRLDDLEEAIERIKAQRHEPQSIRKLRR